MPSIASRTLPLDTTQYERVEAPVSPSVPPTNSNVTLGPGLNTTLRSPLPPIYAATDNIRQFYTGGQTPQYRVLPVPPLTAPVTTASTTITQVVNVTASSSASSNPNGVSSFNGRAGAVVPLTGDYSFSQINGIATVAQGGTGTPTPSLVAGANVSISGTWPNQTINSTGGNFAEDEVVAGSGTAWTLAHTPSPVASLILVQRLPGFGGVILFRGTDYTITGTSITTTNSLSPGVLHAWYSY